MKLLMSILFVLSFNSFSMKGVSVGNVSPIKKIETIDDSSIFFKKKKTVLIFFRGSWCPYCVKQLKDIEINLISKIDSSTQIVAISVDKEIVAKKMKKKFSFTFPIVSDPKAKLLKKFNIVNQLNSKTVDMYKNSYKIDIVGDSGETHHMVAHPAVFIIGKDEKVMFSDVHVNYKQRTKNEDILKELKKI